ncbi:MAG: YdbL family protein [Inquilinaceae bacterium]
MATISRRSLLIACGCGLGLAAIGGVGPAWALTLDEARAAGLVGDRIDGLLGAVTDSAEVRRLVDEVNQRRMAEYRRLAAQNNVPLEAVQKQAGEALLDRAQPGWYIMGATGQWTRK